MNLSLIPPCSAQDYARLAEGPNNSYLISYRVEKGNIKFRYFYFGTGKSYPSVNIDVNQNGMIDNMLDRSYGLTGSGPNWELCSHYLIDETRTTFCGEPQSKAKVKRELLRNADNTFTEFSIPIKELTASLPNGIIHVRIQISNSSGTGDNESWVRTNFPECTSDLNCTGLFDKVYEIKIK